LPSYRRSDPSRQAQAALDAQALNHDLAIDVAVTATTMAIHWGTFSGVMGATIAGLLCSVATSAAKRLFGYIRGNTYYPGVFFVNPTA